MFVADESHGAVHMQVSTIGFDLAKNVFQVHGIDANEKVVARKQLQPGDSVLRGVGHPSGALVPSSVDPFVVR